MFEDEKNSLADYEPEEDDLTSIAANKTSNNR
jgi:hypothetical protein